MQSKGEKTRAEIVDSAKALFYERGYDGTTFSDIVEAAGVYRGNINYYFKTKDDILLAVIDRHREEFDALMAEWTATIADPRERLMAFAGMIVAREAALTRYGCPIGSLNTELGKDRLGLQQSARALFDLFRDWLTAQFRALGADAEAENLALHLLGRAQGVAVIAHVYQDAELLHREVAGLEKWIRAFAPGGVPEP